MATKSSLRGLSRAKITAAAQPATAQDASTATGLERQGTPEADQGLDAIVGTAHRREDNH